MEGESVFTRSIIDEILCWEIQLDQMEGEGGVIRSIIDEIYSWDIQGDQRESESKVLLKEASVNLIIGMSMEIK